MNETALRDRIANTVRSLFGRRPTFGAGGNLNVCLNDGWLMTPTGHCVGDIDPENNLPA